MHIPKGPTAGLELALFEPALQAALQPSPDYDAARWLYVPNTCLLYTSAMLQPVQRVNAGVFAPAFGEQLELAIHPLDVRRKHHALIAVTPVSYTHLCSLFFHIYAL